MKIRFGRHRQEELSDELESHLDMATRDRVERGESANEARASAHREFGNPAIVREVTHDQWGWSWLENLIQDIHFGFRMLRKSPGFTAVAVLTLALGIGANTALFSVVNGVLLNPLPYPHPEQLVEVAAVAPPFPESSMSYPNFLDWARENHTFDSIAAYRVHDFNLTGWGEAQQVRAMQVSASFFPILGYSPLIGRNFTSDEDKRGAAPVAMLSYGLWKSKFGGSPDILDKSLTLNGIAFSVIGVVPQNFYFCCGSTNFVLGDIYTPIGSWGNPDLYNRADHIGIYAVGRLKVGVTLEQARADMDRVARNLAAEYPDTNKKEGVWLAPLKQRMVQDVKPMLLVLLVAVGFVLLIASVNVANLLLARSTGRAREFSIRAALGASQSRVIRQLLTESLLLSLAGGGLGLLLASWGTQAALQSLPEALPRANDVHLDLRVLLFTLSVSLVAGILFGLAPALKTSHPDLHATLKEGGRGASAVRYRTQGVFVVVEMALAVVLLIGAGLAIRSLARLWSVNPGFNPQNIMTFGVAMPASSTKQTPDEIRSSVRQLLSTVASIPGIQSASLTDGAQPMYGDDEWPLWIEGQPKPSSQGEMISALSYIVSPDYWNVMQIPLLRGRLLTAQDDSHSTPVCVIDKDFAERYFSKEDPIGQRLNVYGGDQQYEIVGVVGHVNQWGLDYDATGPVKAQFYTLDQQFPDKFLLAASFYVHAFVVRASSSNSPSVSAIRDALRQIGSDIVAYQFKSMDSIIADSISSRRFAMILLGAFAAIALLLASIGIYGVISYVAGQRTHEIGIRLALGAQRGDVLRLVLGQGARLAVIGVGIGLAAAAALTRLMTTILFGVSAVDPLTFASVAILLSGVALAACYIPARRAMRVDPMIALRYE